MSAGTTPENLRTKMSATPATDRPPEPRVPFRVYLVCYGILGLLLIYALVFRWLRPVVLEEPIRIEPACIAQVQQQIDPNSATWAELTRLPGVGEALAKRIVEYRTERRRADGEGAAGKPVFRTPEDLGAVKGIGRSLIERLRPYLMLPPPETP